MKLFRLLFILIFLSVISACSSNISFIATRTSQPTEIPTKEATPPRETIPGLSVDVPKPDEQLLIDALGPFANAFQLTPEQSDKVEQGMQFVELKDKDGKTFVAALTPDVPETKDFNEAGTPLLIADQDSTANEWVWTEATLNILFEKNGIEGGTGINGWWFGNAQFGDKLRQIMKKQFNQVTIAWGVHWSETEPQQDKFDFTAIDYQVAFAQQNNMKIRVQALVWQQLQMLPDWIKTGNFSKDQMSEIIVNHVRSIVSHYREIIHEWVVVNEPYVYPYIRDDIFYKSLGDDYITIAFKAAREADPTATLIFNHGNNHTQKGMMTKRSLEIVKKLRQEGLIDAVGVQMHIDGSNLPNREDVIKTIQAYGLPVIITELDVDMRDVLGSSEERLQKQAEIYKQIISMCLDTDVCKQVTVWEVGDKYSWLEKQNTNSDATSFDDNLNPKPAFWAMMQALSNNLTP